MPVVAAIAAQPRLTIHDTKIEALRILVVFAEERRSDRDCAPRRTARGHDRVGRRRLTEPRETEVRTRIRRAVQEPCACAAAKMSVSTAPSAKPNSPTVRWTMTTSCPARSSKTGFPSRAEACAFGRTSAESSAPISSSRESPPTRKLNRVVLTTACCLPRLPWLPPIFAVLRPFTLRAQPPVTTTPAPAPATPGPGRRSGCRWPPASPACGSPW